MDGGEIALALGPAVTLMARPPERLFHLVYGADSEEKHEPAGEIDIAAVHSLKALDPKRPIREAQRGCLRLPLF
jgi:hypothetical protein